MKLLFDHNLFPRLVNRLADLFPESTHVYLLGMDQVDDREVWSHAQNNGFTIVTRDSDYNERERVTFLREKGVEDRDVH
jgi:predicted nuclease of predicted toxin-antitoxin system